MTEISHLISGRSLLIRLRDERDLRFLSLPEMGAEAYAFLTQGRPSETREIWLRKEFDALRSFRETDFDNIWHEASQPNPLDFLTIALNHSNEYVGLARIKPFPNGEWEISMFITQAYRQQNLGSEACWLLARAVFETYSASIVFTKFHPDHQASLKLAKFLYPFDAGALSNHAWENSHMVFKLTREEYRQVFDTAESQYGSPPKYLM